MIDAVHDALNSPSDRIASLKNLKNLQEALLFRAITYGHLPEGATVQQLNEKVLYNMFAKGTLFI